MTTHGSVWLTAGAPDLGLPEPPAELRPRVRFLENGRWGTADNLAALTGLGWYANAFEEGDDYEYVVAGIERTAGEDALHYGLAYRGLGLFVQTPLGDPDGVLAAAGRLQDHVLRLLAGNELGGRLTVLWHQWGSRWWHFHADDGESVEEGFGGPIGAAQWLADRMRSAD